MAIFRWLDANGDPLAGASIRFLNPGTTTPSDAIFTDAAMTVPAGALVLDAEGIVTYYSAAPFADLEITRSDNVVLPTIADYQLEMPSGVPEWTLPLADAGLFGHLPLARRGGQVYALVTADGATTDPLVATDSQWRPVTRDGVKFIEWTTEAAAGGRISAINPFTVLAGEFYILKDGGEAGVSPADDVGRANWSKLESGGRLRQIKALCLDFGNTDTEVWRTLGCFNIPNFRQTGNHILSAFMSTGSQNANDLQNLELRLLSENSDNVVVAGRTLQNVSAITTAVSVSSVGVQLRRYTLTLADESKITLPTANAANLRVGQRVRQSGDPFKSGYPASGFISSIGVSGNNTVLTIARLGDSVALASTGTTTQAGALAVYNPIKAQLGLPDLTLEPATDGSGNPYNVLFTLSGKPPFLATVAGRGALAADAVLGEDDTHQTGTLTTYNHRHFSVQIGNIDLDAISSEIDEETLDLTVFFQGRYINGASGPLGIYSGTLTYDEN